MSSWIKAMNPLSAAGTEADALKAARASAIAIFIGVIWGCIGVFILMTSGQAQVQAALANASAQSPEAAGMMGIMGQAMVGMAVVFVAIQLVLGLVQWFKPNLAIPIIFLILVAYGLVTTVIGLAMMGSMDVPSAAQTPTWQIIAGLLVMVVEFLLHIAGIRGVNALKRFRDAQAY